jgi:hypothetical protein
MPDENRRSVRQYSVTRKSIRALVRIAQGNGLWNDFELIGMEAFCAGCLTSVLGAVVYVVSYESSCVSELCRMALAAEITGVAAEAVGVYFLARAACWPG